MPLSWIQKNGQMILYNDFRGLHREAMIAQLDEELVVLKRAGGQVRMLINVTDTDVDKEFITRAKQMSPIARRYLEKEAVIGLNGFTTLVLRAFNSATKGTLKPFKSEAEAIRYLTT
jgi:hypothetical protein